MLLLFVEFALGGLHAELQTAAVVDSYQLDSNLVAFFNDVAGLSDPLFAEFRYVHQAILAGHDLDESAKVHDAYYRHVDIKLADFGLGDYGLYPLPGGVNRFLVWAGDHDSTVVLDVDISTRLTGNLL